MPGIPNVILSTLEIPNFLKKSPASGTFGTPSLGFPCHLCHQEPIGGGERALWLRGLREQKLEKFRISGCRVEGLGSPGFGFSV